MITSSLLIYMLALDRASRHTQGTIVLSSEQTELSRTMPLFRNKDIHT